MIGIDGPSAARYDFSSDHAVICFRGLSCEVAGDVSHGRLMFATCSVLDTSSGFCCSRSVLFVDGASA